MNTLRCHYYKVHSGLIKSEDTKVLDQEVGNIEDNDDENFVFRQTDDIAEANPHLAVNNLLQGFKKHCVFPSKIARKTRDHSFYTNRATGEKH